LEWRRDEAEPLPIELPTCRVDGHWDSLFEGRALQRLEAALPGYLLRHRWFAGKARAIQRTKLLDVLTVHDVGEVTEEMKQASRSLSGGLAAMRMLIVRVDYVEGEPEVYVLPMVFAQGHQEQNILADRPGTGLVSVARSDDGEGASLCDATRESEFWLLLYDAIARGRTIPGRRGEVMPVQTPALERLNQEMSLDTSVHGGEQSNTSAVLGNRLILKMFRRIGEGENPDLEIGRFLTESTRLACVPQVAGALEYQDAEGDHYTLAVLHEFVPNVGDAWVYTLDELGRYLERIASELSGSPPTDALPTGVSLLELAERVPPTAAHDMIGSYLQSAEMLGKRTAELHLALAASTGNERCQAGHRRRQGGWRGNDCHS
jgi:maltose alpha-D-glucosyltransferase/alpha-amylase